MKPFKRIVLDPFCLKQFQVGASSYIPFDPKIFEQLANEAYQTAELADGYAPFCKHIFIPNFTDAVVGAIEITPENQSKLKTCYQARTEKQLPVLKRYFDIKDVVVPRAKYLDLILYSKEQVQHENKAMGNVDPNANVDYDFGIVSIKPQDIPQESSMDPITMMRNALGKEHGGSGVPLNRDTYLKSVQHWTKYALVK